MPSTFKILLSKTGTHRNTKTEIQTKREGWKEGKKE
jgi:hypothetical protein